jgi:hypothetical protein
MDRIVPDDDTKHFSGLSRGGENKIIDCSESINKAGERGYEKQAEFPHKGKKLTFLALALPVEAISLQAKSSSLMQFPPRRL